jgi:hypothetical protein
MASIILAVSTGRVSMNKCPSSIIWSLAFGMSRARMRPLIGGSLPWLRSLQQPTLILMGQDDPLVVHPAMARSWNQ